MSVAKKLQIKDEHAVCVLHQPDGVELALADSHPTTDEPSEADAVLVFVTDRAELEARRGPAVDAASRDALAWIAYPKAKKLGTDLNRDSLWEAMADTGVRPVRQVSIDDTWSALRFRPGS